MVKIKENRTARLTAIVTETLKEKVIKFAENNGDLSESKATEILIIKGLQNQ